MVKVTLLRDDRGREAVKFTTPSGVVAIIDTSIPDTALAKFARSLERKALRRSRRLARSVLAP